MLWFFGVYFYLTDALAIHGVDIFLFEENLHIGGFQLADGIQGIHGVPGEPGDGFGYDQINIPGQGIGDHPVECLPVADRGAGDPLACIDTYEDPVWALVYQLGEIVLLSLHTVQLFIGCGGHPGVSGLLLLLKNCLEVSMEPVFGVMQICLKLQPGIS